MKNYELYKKTCDILFAAYFNDTLEHKNCYACAVGNIVAANNGFHFIKKTKGTDAEIYTGGGVMYWDKENYFQTNVVREINMFTSDNEISDKSNFLISTTGYSFVELKLIERAFERTNEGNSKDEKMYNGLVAVLDCLKEIHEIKDDNEVERFTKHYNHKKQLV